MRPLATLIVVTTVLSCARDQTTAPPMRSGAGPATHSTYTTLGTYSIPIPPTNTLGGAQPVANTGIFVPAGAYYRVRVNGTVSVSANPEYVQAYGTPWDKMGTYGPFGTVDGELIVQLKARNTDGSGTGPISFLNPQYNSASGPDSARSDIVYTSKAIEVQAGRTGIGGVTSDNCCHWSIGMFALAASQTVTVEQVTDVAHVVANPVAVHPNAQVTFTASRDDGGNLIVYNWHWQPDAGQPGNATNLCGGGNPCQMNVAGSGTMLVYTNVGNPTAHVTVYTNFTLSADKTNIYRGDTVTFTPLTDGVPLKAARWRWVSDSTPDSPSCGAANPACKTPINASGTMWAYAATSGGDSVSAHISVHPRRKLLLAPEDTVWVEVGSTVSFAASGEGGAAVVDPRWSGADDDLGLNRVGERRPKRGGPPGRLAFSAVTSSTCADGVTECYDVANDPYTRTVTATVDDSLQSRSVVVIAGYIDHPALGDSIADGATGPCPTCQKADSIKKLDIDSIMKRMDTTSAQCDSAHMQLRRYLENDWIYLFFEKTAKWGRWSPPDYDPIWKLSTWHPWIELSSALWTPPGKKVVMGKQNGIPIVVTVTNHRLEQTIVHEALHAARYDHDSADQFRSTTLKACMNVSSRDW